MADPDLAGYLEMAQESYAVAYVTIACASLLIFDWFLTITDEISNIWNSRWAIPKFLFFVNRYVVVAMLCFNGIASSQTHLPAGFCVFYLRWLVVTITVSQSTIEGKRSHCACSITRRKFNASHSSDSGLGFMYVSLPPSFINLPCSQIVATQFVLVVSKLIHLLKQSSASAVPCLILLRRRRDNSRLSNSARLCR